MLLLIALLCIIVLLLIIFAVILLFARLTFEVEFYCSNVWVRVGGSNKRLEIYERKKKKIKEEEPKDSIEIPTISSIKKRGEALKELYYKEKDNISELAKDTASNMTLKHIDLAITFGTGDAAVTSILNGIFWWAASIAINLADQHWQIKNILNFALSPKYGDKVFEYKGKIIFTTKLYLYFSELRKLRKMKKRNEHLIKIIKGGA
jgi:hypothetical protein